MCKAAVCWSQTGNTKAMRDSAYEMLLAERWTCEEMRDGNLSAAVAAPLVSRMEVDRDGNTHVEFLLNPIRHVLHLATGEVLQEKSRSETTPPLTCENSWLGH